MSDPLLEIKNLVTGFETESGLLKAVDGVSFTVPKGTCVGIVGESGCGKSVTAMSIVRLLPQPMGKILDGQILFKGRDLVQAKETDMHGIRGRHIGVIFQEPMTALNPVHSIGRQIGESLMLHRGMNTREARDAAIQLLQRVRIPAPEQRVDEFPHQLSGGMRQRALIAMGISADAELLLFDEPTKGLDEARIRLVADTLNELDGQTMVCVTHDLSFARDVANRIGVMYAANLIEVADADELYAHPLHPYTRDMLAAMPENGLHFRPGYAPAHDDTRVTGCKYRMRCPNCSEKCAEMPPMADVDGHKVRCWQYV